MKICRCTNCQGTYEDMNPGSNSIDYPDEDIAKIKWQVLGCVEIWVCPKCLTDEYLMGDKKY